MGASFKTIEFDGRWSTSQVSEVLDKMRLEDERLYGCDPYSGSWATIPKVIFPKSHVFETRKEAEGFAQENAVKWEHAVAVRFKEKGHLNYWLVGGWAVE